MTSFRTAAALSAVALVGLTSGSAFAATQTASSRQSAIVVDDQQNGSGRLRHRRAR